MSPVSNDLCPVVTIDPSTGTFQLDTNDQVTYPPSTYSLEIGAYISGFPSSVDTHTYVVNFVDLCSSATVIIPDQEDPIDHTYQGPTSFQASYESSDTSCAVEYACVPPASGLNLCAVGTLDSSTGVFTLPMVD